MALTTINNTILVRFDGLIQSRWMATNTSSSWVRTIAESVATAADNFAHYLLVQHTFMGKYVAFLGR